MSNKNVEMGRSNTSVTSKDIKTGGMTKTWKIISVLALILAIGAIIFIIWSFIKNGTLSKNL